MLQRRRRTAAAVMAMLLQAGCAQAVRSGPEHAPSMRMAVSRVDAAQQRAAGDRDAPAAAGDCIDTTTTTRPWARWTRTGAVVGTVAATAFAGAVALAALNTDSNVSPLAVVAPAAAFIGVSAAIGWGAGWISYDLFGRRKPCPVQVPLPTP